MDDTIKKIVKILKNKGIISIPTDTVAGIMADAKSDEAVNKIYQAKNRAEKKPIAILVNNIEMAEKYIDLNIKARKILKENSPFVTVICNKKNINTLSNNLNLIDDSLAVRVTHDDLVCKIIRELNAPLAASSANLSGKKNQSDIKNKVDLYIEDNNQNQPSKIIDCRGNKTVIVRDIK